MRTFLVALQTLSIIPVRLSQAPDQSELIDSTIAYPMVGYLLGGIAALAGIVVSTFWRAPLPAAAMVMVLVILTGYLHLDGLADSADALLARQSRERLLEIMRDSRVGSGGAVAIAAMLILKVAAVAAAPPAAAWVGIIIAPVIARWWVVLAMYLFPYARAGEGFGAPYARQVKGRHVAVTTAIAAVIVAFMLIAFDAVTPGLFGLTLGILTGWGAAFLFFHRLGGQTGDTYGALIELVEVAVLIGVAVR